MLMDMAIMLFAFGLPVALNILLREPDGKPVFGNFVKTLAFLSVVVAGFCLYDCYTLASDATRQLQVAQAQLQQLGR